MMITNQINFTKLDQRDKKIKIMMNQKQILGLKMNLKLNTKFKKYFTQKERTKINQNYLENISI